jgi:hypothetical protein
MEIIPKNFEYFDLVKEIDGVKHYSLRTFQEDLDDPDGIGFTHHEDEVDHYEFIEIDINQLELLRL